MRLLRVTPSFSSKILIFWLLIIVVQVWARIGDTMESPVKHFGYEPGTDRMLFSYDELIDYLKKMDKASANLQMVEIGKSPMGKMMYLVFISSKENIEQLNYLKQINRRLALDPEIPESERENMLNSAKVFVLATLSMHSDEVGPTQSVPRIVWDLITTEDVVKKEWLNNVVFMMVPCHNPDGMDMIIDHYNKYMNTIFEGSNMPGLYHKYIGHDNNRDFIMLSQKDTKNIARIYNNEWFPHVLVEKHQMGCNNVRYIVPPVHDPIAENIDAELWNWTKIFGSNMIKDMTQQGLSGVSQSYLFDDYAPFFTTASTWKNVISIFTEAASVKLATPLFIEKNELMVYGKGLSEHRKSINMPLPWPAGWWRLMDIVKYEQASILSMIKTASVHRKDILRFRNDLCMKEVYKGNSEPPYYYILPLDQPETGELVNLVNLLMEHGVKVYQLSRPGIFDGITYNSGDIIIPLAQPFRPFIKELMGRQHFPVRHYTPKGTKIRPDDITSWSLPLHMGVEAQAIIKKNLNQPDSIFREIKNNFCLTTAIPDDYKAVIFNCNTNESFKSAFFALELGLEVARLVKNCNIGEKILPSGSFIILNSKKNRDKINQVIGTMQVSPIYLNNLSGILSKNITLPKIALVETYFENIDAGWTRFIFDTYHISYQIVSPFEFQKPGFLKMFDIIIFPDEQKSILMDGKVKQGEQFVITNYPTAYKKGMGKKGLNHLMQFLVEGGIIASWGSSTELFHGILETKSGKESKEEFQLPYKNINVQLKKSGLYCTGAFMKIHLLENHPLTLGMRKESGIVYGGGPVFSTSIPLFDMDRRIIGTYPEKNILQSGYCEKEELLGNRSCLIWIKKGKGQIVLFGFRPQFRGSTSVTYKLLFNSILLPTLKKQN